MANPVLLGQVVLRELVRFSRRKNGRDEEQEIRLQKYLKVETPPEFRGHSGIWTPEDLLVGSVNSCIMTTFLIFMEKEGIELLYYESDADGLLERVECRFMFSEIVVKTKVRIKPKEDVEGTENILSLSEKHCLISNSIKSKVIVTPEIEVGGA